MAESIVFLTIYYAWWAAIVYGCYHGYTARSYGLFTVTFLLLVWKFWYFFSI